MAADAGLNSSWCWFDTFMTVLTNDTWLCNVFGMDKMVIHIVEYIGNPFQYLPYKVSINNRQINVYKRKCGKAIIIFNCWNPKNTLYYPCEFKFDKMHFSNLKQRNIVNLSMLLVIPLCLWDKHTLLLWLYENGLNQQLFWRKIDWH